MNKTLMKRLIILAFASITVLATTQFSSSAKGPKNDLEGITGTYRDSVNSGDCTVLNKKKTFTDPKEYAHELSRVTEMAVAKMPQGSYNLATAKIPRRNFIDNEIFSKMDDAGVTPAPLANDEEFLRRATLDITGRIPSAEKVRQFVSDSSPNKREALVNSLIGSPEYVDRWTMFFGDVVKNVSFTQNLDRFEEGRNTLYQTIKTAVAQNTPYNQFVTNILTSSGNSFTNGAASYAVGNIVQMGPAQDTFDNSLVQASTRFLGISTFDCLLCHNGNGHTNALNVWATQVKRTEAWEMAAFFSRTAIRRNIVSRQPNIFNFDVFDVQAGNYMLNTANGNRPERKPEEGKSVTVTPRYIFSNETPAPGENYRAAFARFMTKDRQFARATVNYIWKQYFGMGIVEPADNFDLARLDPNNPPSEPFGLQATHPELLERLTDEFISNNYDIQHIMRLITQSSTYQLSSRYNGVWKEEFVPFFARKFARRMQAEEIHDAITVSTGILPSYTVFGFSTPIQYAMQLPDTLEPFNRRDRSANTQASVLGNVFLNTFERGDRDDLPRSNTPSISQGLTLMNSPFVNARINASNANSTLGRLLAANNQDQKLVEDLFLTVLSRYPNKTEMNQALNMLKPNRNQGAEDLMWVLINKIDFIYNY